MQPAAQTEKNGHETGKPARSVEILVNGKPVQVPSEVTGAEIKAAAKVPPDFRLFRVKGQQEIPVGDDERLRVRQHEKFVASPTLDPAFISNPKHAEAVETVRDAFPNHQVVAEEPGDGTTVITVRSINAGDGWNVQELHLSVKLHITFPSSPPYPFYGPPGLARTDGRAFSQIQPQVQFEGAARAQISLSKPFDPTIETLGARLVSVVDWLRNPR